MAQHDYIIDNQSAPAARTDINNALAAIRTVNSGATAPASTIADMLWYETDTFTLWKRNAGNTAWVSMGVFNETTGKFAPNMTFSTQAEAEDGVDNTTPMTPLRVSQAITALSSSVRYQVFTASGTWTKPTGISANTLVIVHAWGGGGAGGDSLGNVSAGTGGGGGGGEFFEFMFLASDLGATEAVVVGSGGVAVSGAAGNAGASSTFAGKTAWGGAGGASRASSNPFANGGAGGGYYSIGGGPAGGVDGGGASNGDAWTGGGGGSAGNSGGYATNGGGGGGGASPSSGVGPGGISTRGGNGGAGANNTNAVSGSAPGGGGGGCSNSSGLPGNGARGEVRIWTIG